MYRPSHSVPLRPWRTLNGPTYGRLSRCTHRPISPAATGVENRCTCGCPSGRRHAVAHPSPSASPAVPADRAGHRHRQGNEARDCRHSAGCAADARPIEAGQARRPIWRAMRASVEFAGGRPVERSTPWGSEADLAWTLSESRITTRYLRHLGHALGHSSGEFHISSTYANFA